LVAERQGRALNMTEKIRTPLSRIILRIVLALLIIAAFILTLRWIGKTGLLKQVLDWIRSLGPWGPLVFIVIYIAATVLFLPALILTVGAGFVYGMGRGSIYVLIAANIAANIAFLLGRHIARNWIARKLESQPKFKAIDDAVAREGWKIVALIRLAPVFPFSLMSYAFGLTRIPFWKYAAANFAMIPGTLMYIYFGAVARDLTETVTTPPWVRWMGGAFTILAVFFVTRVAKRALTKKIS
jgi:uncharacterized membrane protein YdjX (TVP38/TMEM64 family)